MDPEKLVAPLTRCLSKTRSAEVAGAERDPPPLWPFALIHIVASVRQQRKEPNASLQAHLRQRGGNNRAVHCLGGSVYAATQLKKNSVGTKQIKNGAVTAAKIKKGTITGSKVNLSTLGTVPSATSSASATTAATASALTAPEALHVLGSPGQPPFEDGSSNPPGGSGLNFAPVASTRITRESFTLKALP